MQDHPDNNVLAYEILGPADRAYSHEEFNKKFDRKCKELALQITDLPREDIAVEYALRVVGNVFRVEARLLPAAQSMLGLDEHTAQPVEHVIQQFVCDYPEHLVARHGEYLEQHTAQPSHADHQALETVQTYDWSARKDCNGRFFDDLHQLAKDDAVSIHTPQHTLHLPLPHPDYGPIIEGHYAAQVNRIEFDKLTLSALSMQGRENDQQALSGLTRAQLWLTTLPPEHAARVRLAALQELNAQRPLLFHARQLPCKHTDRHLTLELIGVWQ